MSTLYRIVIKIKQIFDWYEHNIVYKKFKKII